MMVFFKKNLWIWGHAAETVPDVLVATVSGIFLVMAAVAGVEGCTMHTPSH